jgi:hypothetical protein
MPKRAEKIAVRQRTLVESLVGEKFAIQRGQVEQAGQFRIAEDQPQDSEAVPKIVVVRECGPAVKEMAQTRYAVMVAIYGIGAEKPAIFRHQQEQKAVNQAEELPVERISSQSLFDERAAEFVVCVMSEKAVCQLSDTRFDPIPKVIAHAATLFDGVLVVALEEGFASIPHSAREPSAMNQSVEC